MNRFPLYHNTKKAPPMPFARGCHFMFAAQQPKLCVRLLCSRVFTYLITTFLPLMMYRPFTAFSTF